MIRIRNEEWGSREALHQGSLPYPWGDLAEQNECYLLSDGIPADESGSQVR